MINLPLVWLGISTMYLTLGTIYFKVNAKKSMGRVTMSLPVGIIESLKAKKNKNGYKYKDMIVYLIRYMPDRAKDMEMRALGEREKVVMKIEE